MIGLYLHPSIFGWLRACLISTSKKTPQSGVPMPDRGETFSRRNYIDLEKQTKKKKKDAPHLVSDAVLFRLVLQADCPLVESIFT